VPFESYPEELGTKQVLSIIDLLYDQGVFSLDLTGGEPLMRKDIIDVLSHCNDLDIDVGLATNGVLLTKKRIAELVRVWDRKKTVHVSVDASTPEKFFQITGSEDLLKVLECTKSLLEYGLDVIWNFVYTMENKEELVPVCVLASELGVKKMFVLPVIRTGRASNIQVSFRDLQAFLVHFPEIEKKFPSIKFRITPATPLDFLVPLLEAGWNQQKILKHFPYARSPLQDEHFKEIRNIGCIGGVGRWAVNAQGDVFPCELFVIDNTMRCGNLLEDSFQDCLYSCSSLLDVSLEHINQCTQCDYAGICGGGCRARAFMKYKDLCMPDPACPFSSEKMSIRRTGKSDNSKRKIQHIDQRAFTIKVNNCILRVRKESFGGIAYILGHEQQINVNRDGYIILEILEKTQDRREVIKELEKRNVTVEEKYVYDFLDELSRMLMRA
jgi:radical SAM protein with 4Fe4S-binding SPASM domain